MCGVGGVGVGFVWRCGGLNLRRGGGAMRLLVHQLRLPLVTMVTFDGRLIKGKLTVLAV